MSLKEPIADTELLLLLATLERGGAERQTVLLCQGLTAQGIFPKVVALRDGPFRADLTNLGVETQITGGGPAGALRALRLIRKISPASVMSYHTQTNLLLPFLGRQIASIAGLRIVRPDGNARSPRTVAIYGAEVRSARRICGAIANSHESQQYAVERGFDPARTLVVANGFDTDAFVPDATLRETTRASFNFNPETTVLVRIGNLRPPKDYPTFLHALAELGMDNRYHALIVGRGDQAGLQVLARKLNIERHVTFLGPRTDINAILNAADVNVSSSSSESFPNVIAEGLAVGIATVATDVGDSDKILQGFGTIVPPRDPKRVGEGIRLE